MTCPNCQVDTSITEQLYGALYTCRSCSAVYFINFEGQPEFGDVSEEVLTELVSEPALSSEPPPFVSDASRFESSFESSLEPLIDSVDMVSFDNKLDEQFNVQLDAQLPVQPAPTEIPVETLQPSILTEESHSFGAVAQEISDFGNTETQLAGLNYDLKITGLDTQETKRLFLEAIGDSKLAWDSNEIMKSIKNGQIEFQKLNPVKAYILAKRLQFLDIEKQWRQNAMS